MAGAAENANDKNFLKWALSVLMDLLFPGRKPKEIIEEGSDDDIDTGMIFTHLHIYFQFQDCLTLVNFFFIYV